MPINLMLVDDHQLLLDAWVGLFAKGNEIHVVATANTPADAREKIRSHQPDVIVCDINLGAGKESGFSLVPELKAIAPSTPILAVSMYAAPAIAKKMIKAGASGYVSKNSPFEELAEAVKALYAGKQFVCRAIMERMTQELLLDTDSDEQKIASLSERELLIMQHIKEGFSSAEIGLNLGISLKTVEAHRYNILKKLDFPNSATLINFMNRHGL